MKENVPPKREKGDSFMYEKLFSPGAIGTLTIPNRIVMTAASASLSQPRWSAWMRRGGSCSPGS